MPRQHCAPCSRVQLRRGLLARQAQCPLQRAENKLHCCHHTFPGEGFQMPASQKMLFSQIGAALSAPQDWPWRVLGVLCLCQGFAVCPLWGLLPTAGKLLTAWQHILSEAQTETTTKTT